jgi:hypothetical protein
MARYNTPSWKAAVMCQEIGHDYGLGHVDEDFNTDATTSCMDYTSNPAGNEHPYGHDYEELETIYDHADATSFAVVRPGRSASAPPFSDAQSVPGDIPAQWGEAIHRDAHGRPDMFALELGNGRRKITHVLWAIGEGPQGVTHH